MNKIVDSPKNIFITVSILVLMLIAIGITLKSGNDNKDSVTNQLVKQTLFAGSCSDVKFAVPRYSSVCCESKSYFDYDDITLWSKNSIDWSGPIDENDVWETTYSCKYPSGCAFRPDLLNINCPSYSILGLGTFPYQPEYSIMLNDKYSCSGDVQPNLYYTDLYNSPVTGSHRTCSENEIFYGKIKVTVSCENGPVWEKYNSPTNIGLKLQYKGNQLVIYGHDIPKYPLSNTAGCINQIFLNEISNSGNKFGDLQPKPSDDLKIPSSVKTGDTSSTLGGFLDSIGKLGGANHAFTLDTIYNLNPIPQDKCALALYDYRELPSLNVHMTNDVLTYCYSDLSYNKALLKFTTITDNTGCKWNVPTSKVKNVQCCTDQDCAGIPGTSCSNTDFTCSYSGQKCYGDQDCVALSNCYGTEGNNVKKIVGKCDTAKDPDGNGPYIGMCKPEEVAAKCCDAYCEGIGKSCNMANGCITNLFLCPIGKCCKPGFGYINTPCDKINKEGICCDNVNLPDGDGVGECKPSCEVCDYDKICESNLGETYETCTDCPRPPPTDCDKNDDCDSDEYCKDHKCETRYCSSCFSWLFDNKLKKDSPTCQPKTVVGGFDKWTDYLSPIKWIERGILGKWTQDDTCSYSLGFMALIIGLLIFTVVLVYKKKNLIAQKFRRRK